MLLWQWYERYGEGEADARYDHLRILVQHECLRAYNSVYSEEEPFGQRMLDTLRERLDKRMEEIKKRYDDCCDEHLEGIAGMLSEQCAVWWSKEFKLKEEML